MDESDVCDHRVVVVPRPQPRPVLRTFAGSSVPKTLQEGRRLESRRPVPILDTGVGTPSTFGDRLSYRTVARPKGTTLPPSRAEDDVTETPARRPPVAPPESPSGTRSATASPDSTPRTGDDVG